MASIAEKTVEGFGAFLEKQKSVPGDCRLTLVQFDTQYELVYYDKPLRKVPPLRLVPRGARLCWMPWDTRSSIRSSRSVTCRWNVFLAAS